MQPKSARRIQELAIERELGHSFGRYAAKVILDRAIPDIRDGLKPVQRRIIYAMFEAGNTHDKPYRKSAKTVGDVMGNYHPHGDQAIYAALVRLAQPWKMRYPLIDGHGNFGSQDDDPPAAMRYTEARLSAVALELLADIDRGTVPWRPNFDDKAEEPVVLPGGFLNLLCNGSSGVSAGFATEVPPHHLGEVTDACLALLRDPHLDTRALMGHVRGPDFPTGGILMGAEGLEEAYQTGKGRVVLRGKHTVEQQRDGRELLVFTELPYLVVKSELVRQLDALRLDKQVQGLLDVRDESGRDGLRVVLELARGADTEGVLAFLFKKTELQVYYHLNLVTIWGQTPRQVGLRSILTAFLEHRRDVVRRRSQHDKDKAERRLHEVEGLCRAVDVLDEVIATIRRSSDRPEAHANLMLMGFSELQADAILELRLARLTNLQIVQLTQEREGLVGEIARLSRILGEAAECDRVVAEELAALKKRHADARRTELRAEVQRIEVALEVMVKPQDVVVGVTREGWVKRASVASYQQAGGDRRSAGVRPGDRMMHVLETNTTHTVCVFSHTGQCYPISVHQIPETKWGETGTALVNVCGIGRDEAIVSVIARKDFPEDLGFLFTTASGLVKATSMAELKSGRSSGLTAVKLSDGDRLASVLPTDRTGEVLLLSHTGQGIRFPLAQVAVQGRAAQGVWGIRLDAGDEVVGAILFEPADDLYIALFTKSGKAKLTPLGEHPLQHRGGKGVRLIVRRAGQPHQCVAVAACRFTDRFELVDTQGNEHTVEVARIPVTARDGNAWTLVNLRQGALVALVERREAEAPAAPGA